MVYVHMIERMNPPEERLVEAWAAHREGAELGRWANAWSFVQRESWRRSK